MNGVSFASRRIRRLSLQAPSHEIAHHGVVLLEDALHTASLPQASYGTIVVIRRLNLGRIDPTAGSAALALQIERVSRSVAYSAVPASSPDAPQADAVVFRDSAEALMLLASRLSSRRTFSEWYWKSVFPGLKSLCTVSAIWHCLLEQAHDQAAPLAAAAGVVKEALKCSEGTDVVAELSVTTVCRWLLRAQLDPASQTQESAAAQIPFDPRPVSVNTNLLSIISKWDSESPRAFWLAAVFIVIEQPSMAGSPGLALRAGMFLKRIACAAQASKENEADPDNLENKSIKSSPMATGQEVALGPSSEEPKQAAPIERKPDISHSTDTRTSDKNPDSTSERERVSTEPVSVFTNSRTSLLTGEWSEYAGLFFLIPLLNRLGITEFLDANPVLADSGFARRILLLTGRRVGMPDADPLVCALDESSDESTAQRPFTLTSTLRDFLEQEKCRDEFEGADLAWSTAVRHLCRRSVRMGLVSLLRRRGRVMVSRVHIDVCFSLQTADLRVRRQALDVDPGWVPWLSRVIRFHYDDSYKY